MNLKFISYLSINFFLIYSSFVIAGCGKIGPNNFCNKFSDSTNNKTFFSIRPQDSNSARDLLKRVSSSYIYENDCLFGGVFNFVFEYQKSFNGSDLGRWFLFNGTNCATVGISGVSEVFDVDGDQIGISTANQNQGSIGQFCIKPEIENFIFDLDFFFDSSRVCNRLWLDFDFIVVHARSNLDFCQTSSAESGLEYPAGLNDLNCNETPIPYDSILCALIGDEGYGAIPPLNCGKFSSKNLTKTGLAAIHCDIGYDFCKTDESNFSASARLVIPTGSKPHAKYLFDPVIGPNGSWQLGATINAHDVIYGKYCDGNQVRFYLDAIFTHLFARNQNRLFNLNNNGPGSQYLLLKKFEPGVEIIGLDVVGAERVANVLCGEAKIGADFMFDGSFMFNFSNTCNGFFGNLGYNLWVRTKEKIKDGVCFKHFSELMYGIKGVQPLSVPIDFEICPMNSPICPLDPPACQEQICCVTDKTTASQSTLSQPSVADAQTVFLTDSDINFDAPLHPLAISNKIFGSIGHFWKSYKHPVYILIGGEVEFGVDKKALNQWSVLIDFAINF